MLLLGPYHFCALLSPSLYEMFPCVSNFLEEISSLSHSVVFLYFFAVITKEGFLISPCYSLELCTQMALSLLFSFAFVFSSFYSYLYVLLRQPFSLFTNLFLRDNHDDVITNLEPDILECEVKWAFRKHHYEQS